jgi:hypothetical protein
LPNKRLAFDVTLPLSSQDSTPQLGDQMLLNTSVNNSCVSPNSTMLIAASAMPLSFSFIFGLLGALFRKL